MQNNQSKTPLSDIVYKIMKGLKPEIVKYIGILDKNNLSGLKPNIKKYESIEFNINDNYKAIYWRNQKPNH